MKLNISYPQHGSQKLIELDDEKKTRLFYDRRMAEEVPADALGDEWKGYILKITGGNDKQGFAMKQGVLLNHRTRLLLDGTTSGFHPWKRPGHRKRKSVRGCIIGPDIAVINAIIIKKGDSDLPGLTNPDSVRPSLRGPKRASNIRKLWGLSKEEDVRQFVSRKKIKDGKNGKPRFKSPKIQRLVTPLSLHRKKRRIVIKKQRREKSKKEASEYAELLANIRRDKRKALIEKRRALSERRSSRKSERKSEKGEPETEKKEKKEKKREKREKRKTQKRKERKNRETPENQKN
jgi:small subunit ribosomal protein S6e